jgi:hypothetical protein
LDTERFDDLTRRIEQTRVSRSGLLRGLAGGALALAGAVVLGSDAGAAKRRRRRPNFRLVTFNPSTGKGDVGKGDVQLAFGWNNTQLQKNASGVDFLYDHTDTFAVTCVWEHEAGKEIKTHTQNVTQHNKVKGTVEFSMKQKNQVTGWHLNGWEERPYLTGTVPMEGDACAQGKGLVTSVDHESSHGGLYARFNDRRVQIG